MTASPAPLPRALVYMTARDCEMYVGAALSSLARQTHDALHVLFIDDASTDDTGEIARQHLESLFPQRHTFVRNDSAWGKARNASVHLREHAARAGFVAVLDGDDQLVVPEILARMAERYAAGDDVVWTNYVTDRGQKGSNGPLDPRQSPRGQGWKTSHFFSFRAELLTQVPESYFRRGDGSWFPAACDFALAFPVLDQTRRYHYIDQTAYRYTASNPRSHHNTDPQARGLNSTLQMACAREVLAKPPLPCTRPVAGAAPAPGAAPRTAPDAWALCMAQALATHYPALLDLAALPDVPAPPPGPAWALHRLLEPLGEAPRVLEIGHGPWTLPLALMAQARGGSLCSIGTDAPRRAALERRLQVLEAAQSATVVATTAVQGQLHGVDGSFVDLGVLGDAGGFHLIVVSADVLDDRAPPSLAQALPACAGLLSEQRFRFLLLTESSVLQQRLAEVWSKLSDELHYQAGASGGIGLLVSGG